MTAAPIAFRAGFRSDRSSRTWNAHTAAHTGVKPQVRAVRLDTESRAKAVIP